jgi:hypothetical protein
MKRPHFGDILKKEKKKGGLGVKDYLCITGVQIPYKLLRYLKDHRSSGQSSEFRVQSS